MENDFLTIEAFAHYMRGAVTVFFLFWSVRLYRFTRRSRMMKWLFAATLYILLSHLKDVIFLVNEWKNSNYLDNIVNVTDLIFIPLISAFFLEACRPGFATSRRVAMVVGLQAVFIPIYSLYPVDRVLDAAYMLSLFMVVYTVIAVVIFTATYHRRLSENYSYRENIDVKWVAVSCIVYFPSLYIYISAFDDTTWLSEALYNLYSMMLWSVLFVLANRHRVMMSLFPQRVARRETAASPPSTEKDTCSTTASDDSPSVPTEASSPLPADTGEAASVGSPVPTSEAEQIAQQYREKVLAERLNRCLEQEKPFLNPKLTLSDMSLAVGTNKTYLSDYINKTLGTTFYELINTYRVEAACALIRSMSEGERIPMTEVAERSGFNSLSSFNRYFVKVKKITPKQFYFYECSPSKHTSSQETGAEQALAADNE